MQWQGQEAITKHKYWRQTSIDIHGHMSIFHHNLHDMGDKHHNGTCVAGESITHYWKQFLGKVWFI